MKIRAGFVSNSSSASFLLTFNISKEDFIKKVYGNVQTLDRYYLSHEIKKCIEISKNNIKQLQISSEESKWLLTTLQEEIDSLKKYETLLADIENISEENVLTHIVGGINEDSLGNVELSHWTCQYNGTEDIPLIWLAIIGYIVTEYPTVKHKLTHSED